MDDEEQNKEREDELLIDDYEELRLQFLLQTSLDKNPLFKQLRAKLMAFYKKM